MKKEVIHIDYADIVKKQRTPIHRSTRAFIYKLHKKEKHKKTLLDLLRENGL